MSLLSYYCVSATDLIRLQLYFVASKERHSSKAKFCFHNKRIGHTPLWFSPHPLHCDHGWHIIL